MRSAALALLVAALPAAAAENPVLVAMGRILALMVMAERCDVLIPNGPRQALMIEGERLQGLAGISQAEMDRYEASLSRLAPPSDCVRVRTNLDATSRGLLDDVRKVR